MMQASCVGPLTLYASKCIVLSPEDTEVKVECFKLDTVESARMAHAHGSSTRSNRAPWVTCFKLEDSEEQPVRAVGTWADVLGPHTREEPFLINYIHPDNQLPCHDPVLITGPPCLYIVAFNATNDQCIRKITAHLHRVLRYIDMQAFFPLTRLEGQLLGNRKPSVFILLDDTDGQQDLKDELLRETRRYRMIDIQITDKFSLNRENLHASRLELRMKHLDYLKVFAEEEVVSFGELNKKIQNKPELEEVLRMYHKLGFVYFRIPHDTDVDDAIVFTQPRCLYDLLRPVAKYQQHKSEDGCTVFQLLSSYDVDCPKIEQNALGNLLADMGIAMKTNYGEHIIIATLEDHIAPVEQHYCMDPLLVACKSSPGVCYMPNELFWGVAYRLSKIWDMELYSPSYFQYHKRGAATVIHVTSREHFLEIGIQQYVMNRTYLKDAEPLPQQLHKTCTEVRQAVTKELFIVTQQLRGGMKICDNPVDQCICDNHKNFNRHFPVGFRCSCHPNCLMQFQGHIDSGFCLECGRVRDPHTTYKQEIWFLPPKPTVKTETRSMEIEGHTQPLVFLVNARPEAGVSVLNGSALKDSTMPHTACGIPMSPWYDSALVALKEDLMTNISISDGLKNMLEIPAGGLMTRGEAQTVACLQGDREQMGKVIEILRGKGDEQFHIFCNMLQKYNYSVWATELQKEADKFKRQESREVFICT